MSLTKEQVLTVLKTCKDPELGHNVVDLGLIYGIRIGPANAVSVTMTLTTPACPIADAFVDEVTEKLKTLPGVGRVKVELTFEPLWTSEKLSAELKAELGLD